MRTAKRSFSDQRISSREQSGNTVDFCQFQPFIKCKCRHNSRNSSRNHRFSCPRRPDHKQIVKTADCNLHGSFQTFLSSNITEIQFFFTRRFYCFSHFFSIRIRTLHIAYHFLQIANSNHLHIRYQCRFPEILIWNNTKPALFLPRPDDYRQNP